MYFFVSFNQILLLQIFVCMDATLQLYALLFYLGFAMQIMLDSDIVANCAFQQSHLFHCCNYTF
jgi:hypothetical protein